MQIEQLRPTVYRITLHAYELATLTAAARYVLEGTEGEMTPEVQQQLADVMKRYDDEFRRLHSR